MGRPITTRSAFLHLWDTGSLPPRAPRRSRRRHGVRPFATSRRNRRFRKVVAMRVDQSASFVSADADAVAGDAPPVFTSFRQPPPPRGPGLRVGRPSESQCPAIKDGLRPVQCWIAVARSSPINAHGVCYKARPFTAEEAGAASRPAAAAGITGRGVARSGGSACAIPVPPVRTGDTACRLPRTSTGRNAIPNDGG
ncbi:hypothetical protein F7D09_1213 [Bifidobacterium leontopitheci]|uniref:Uncharacterized protein n=1 Tax=Bifidobacterium leontopitheci TaxID=2650774 RepID=A0A6I1GLT1_9BIFI|nr:hypothetical protein F7D09_1213 [Bifidobacterium leontopitheci]